MSGSHSVRVRAALSLLAATSAVALWNGAAHGAPVLKDDNAINLDQPSSWVGGAVPTAADVATWDATVSAANVAGTLGSDLAWAGVRVTNPGGNVSIATGNTLTIGASGVDLASSTRNLAFANALALSADQTWTVAAGRTLSFSNALNLNAGVPVQLTIAGAGTVDGNNAAAVIGGANGGLVKNGTGTLILGALNTYTGTTTVNNGQLTLRMDTVVPATNSPPGSIPIIPSASTLIVGGGTVRSIGAARLSGSGAPAWVEVFSRLTIAAGDSSFTQQRGSSARVINTFTNIGHLTGGTAALIDVIDGAGLPNANSGGYRAGNNTAVPGLIVDGVIPYLTYTTRTDGNNAITSWFVPSATGTGTGNNGAAYAAYTASTATTLGVSTNNVDVLTDVAVPAGANVVNTLRFNDVTAGRTITMVGGDSLVVDAGGILVTNRSGDRASVITGGTLAGAAAAAFNATSAAELIVINHDNPTNGANAYFEIGSTIVDNGSATALTKSGIGTLRLTNANNTYTGNNYLNAGITRIAGDGSLGAAPVSATAGSVTFTGGTLQFAAATTLNANRGLQLNDKGGTLDTNGNDVGYAGVIAGTGPLTKAGVGALNLSGPNTYSGATSIAGGSIVATNAAALGTGSATVGAAGTLKVGDGSALTLGGLSGLSAVAGATLEQGAFGSSIALASGTFGLSSINLDLNNLYNVDGTYVLIDAANVLGNTIAGTTSFVDADLANHTFAFAVDPTTGDGVLTVSALVPEPAALAALGLFGTLFVRRSRRC